LIARKKNVPYAFPDGLKTTRLLAHIGTWMTLVANVFTFHKGGNFNAKARISQQNQGKIRKSVVLGGSR
jgi:hypothetical protein